MKKQNKDTKPEASEKWPPRILIVEDNPVILQFMSKVLITLGITPTMAENERDAIENLTADSSPGINGNDPNPSRKYQKKITDNKQQKKSPQNNTFHPIEQSTPSAHPLQLCICMPPPLVVVKSSF